MIPFSLGFGHGNDTRWLGSGIYKCGVCGATMRPAPYGGTGSTKGRVRKFLYRCREKAHLTISTDPTDAYVRAAVADLIRDLRIMAAMRPGDDPMIAADREERAKLSRRLDAFERDYAAGGITAKQPRAVTDRVSFEIEAVDARMAKALRASVSRTILRADDPGATFLEAPIANCRRHEANSSMRMGGALPSNVGVPRYREGKH